MFLQVPAHPGSSGQRAVKRLCVCMCHVLILLDGQHERYPAFAPVIPQRSLLEKKPEVCLYRRLDEQKHQKQQWL